MARKKPSKPVKTPRITITLTGDLKERMQAVTEDVNWSAVASRAFESKLAEIAARKGKIEMSDVIQKFRAQAQEDSSDMYQAGFECGQEWAKSPNGASRKQLVRLEKRREKVGEYWSEEFCNEEGSPCEDFYRVIETEFDRYACKEFWNFAIGEDQVEEFENNPDAVQGFADGALDVWFEVKHQI